jgi:hypothetical protein
MTVQNCRLFFPTNKLKPSIENYYQNKGIMKQAGGYRSAQIDGCSKSTITIPFSLAKFSLLFSNWLWSEQKE